MAVPTPAARPSIRDLLITKSTFGPGTMISANDSSANASTWLAGIMRPAYGPLGCESIPIRKSDRYASGTPVEAIGSPTADSHAAPVRSTARPVFAARPRRARRAGRSGTRSRNESPRPHLPRRRSRVPHPSGNVPGVGIVRTILPVPSRAIQLGRNRHGSSELRAARLRTERPTPPNRARGLAPRSVHRAGFLGPPYSFLARRSKQAGPSPIYGRRIVERDRQSRPYRPDGVGVSNAVPMPADSWACARPFHRSPRGRSAPAAHRPV